jgi:hypothetical protein
MNIKIKVDESSPASVKATLYVSDTNSNIGTLWVTRDELKQLTEILTYGISEDDTLEVVDDTYPSNDDTY